MAGHLTSTLPADVDRLRELPRSLRSRVCGQEQALNRIAAAVQRRELGAVPLLGRERCLIFAGPTGVGKTETARALAELIFGEGHLHRFEGAMGSDLSI